MNGKSNKITVYLIKEEFSDNHEIVNENCKFYNHELGALFYKESAPASPTWVRSFFNNTLPELKIQVSSAAALLLVRMENEPKRIFAVTFGTGRHLLLDGVIEERFGLKVALNSLDPKSLRSIDKVNLGGSAKHSREQLSAYGSADSFGIDIEQDLISSVTGRAKVEQFGAVISGKDSLSLTSKFNIDNISELLNTCHDYYVAEHYKESFDWIDHIKDIRDKKQISALNEALITKLNLNELDKIWIAPPEIIEWQNLLGFRYIKAKKAQLMPDLSLTDLMDVLSGTEITEDALREKKIHFVAADNETNIKSWSIYSCIYCELDREGKLFVLNHGKWYEVERDFTKIIIQSFKDTNQDTIELIEYSKAHKNENDYNIALTDTLQDAVCLDAKNISHGGGYSKIEFCDVLTKQRQIIHVKRYSGSAQLSHLFAQGVVSGELFAGSHGFRLKVNDLLKPDFKLVDPATRPDTGSYEIIYGIISHSEKDLDIPFFSKVSLKNAKQRLEGLGYKVSIKKIKADMSVAGDDAEGPDNEVLEAAE